MEPTIKEASPTLTATLDVECPYCGEYFDLFKNDDDGVFLVPIFNNRWEFLTGLEVECPECLKEFKLSEVIW